MRSRGGGRLLVGSLGLPHIKSKALNSWEAIRGNLFLHQGLVRKCLRTIRWFLLLGLRLLPLLLLGVVIPYTTITRQKLRAGLSPLKKLYKPIQNWNIQNSDS